ncbi:hypothetical protein PSPO01_07991 [Paraphaeosphaeria sporulosa]
MAAQHAELTHQCGQFPIKRPRWGAKLRCGRRATAEHGAPDFSSAQRTRRLANWRLSAQREGARTAVPAANVGFGQGVIDEWAVGDVAVFRSTKRSKAPCRLDKRQHCRLEGNVVSAGSDCTQHVYD